jgi:Ca2+-transporting ATPase
MSAVISFIISMLSNEGHENELASWVEPCVIFTILVLNACVGIY